MVQIPPPLFFLKIQKSLFLFYRMKISDIITYEAFIVVGVLMVIGTGLKLFVGYNFSSDWFWLIGGIGLTVEGTLAYFKQALVKTGKQRP